MSTASAPSRVATSRRTSALCVTVAVAVLVAFGASSCSKPDHSIPKAEYLRKADAICRRANDAVIRAKSDAVTTDRGGQAKFVKKLTDDLLAAIAKVRKLGYPAGDEDALDGWFGAYEIALRQLGRNAGGLADVDPKSFQHAIDGMRRYGFKACGKTSVS
jgi:hypothetical protein